MPAALVTGGAARLGRAMALYLAGRGYAVAIHYNSNKDAAEAVAAECGNGAITLGADLLNEDETQNLLPEAAQKLGQPITVLINTSPRRASP